MQPGFFVRLDRLFVRGRLWASEVALILVCKRRPHRATGLEKRETPWMTRFLQEGSARKSWMLQRRAAGQTTSNPLCASWTDGIPVIDGCPTASTGSTMAVATSPTAPTANRIWADWYTAWPNRQPSAKVAGIRVREQEQSHEERREGIHSEGERGRGVEEAARCPDEST